MAEYTKAREDVVSNNEILPLFSLEDDYKSQVKTAEDKGIERGIKRGIKLGRNDEKLKMAKSLKDENVDLNIISKTTGLSMQKVMML